jgi:phosphoenolpyruvate carboxykinase (GTP)
MADYFAHWLKIGKKDGVDLPRVFYVNWFRKDADGKFLWPGFGENSRVLEWVFRRCEGEAEAVETPVGLLPAEGEIDTEGLEISEQAMRELLSVDLELVKAQLPQVKEHLAQFGESLPPEVTAQLQALEQRLG